MVNRVGIAGGSGYTGIELIRILLGHPEVEIAFITSEKNAGQKVSSVSPSFSKILNLNFISVDQGLKQSCDLVFVALPHKTAMSVVPSFLKNCGKVIDFSADYRLKDTSVYEEWYSTKHTSPELCKTAIYGLPELNGEKIKNAPLVANPGCYATSIILAIAPLIKEKLINLKSIIADSKSGISGAGRTSDPLYSFPERNDSVVAYNVACHRHMPEIEQELLALSGSTIHITFTPQLVPMNRGILSNVYADLKRLLPEKDILNLYKSFYNGKPFIRIGETGKAADTKNVKGSNFCDLSVHIDKRNQRIIICSAIDNLVKGASGQAVQNMNLMLGFDKQTGLQTASLFP
tara:strand:+ start:3493 stop:4533 length:1041 start_codon:yes stop_codon:yes gene_type:complete